nr:SSI family serine proteinase inhibitor [Kibdelosporangium sp. MJ126-NF4]CEL14604.1 Protease inhibitor, SSI family (subtilisin inhibitor) [Kibdelosporangium sp. MJ126-NF4]CTQ96767.1 Protease inhibitor, SSI family (subtilisin inhibitor) [Kibdelosporangium sp. MJ126-NF4]
MQSSLKPLAVGACVSALASALLIAPASAAPAVPTLLLSVQTEQSLLLADSRTLGCDEYPEVTTGTHPRREQACAELSKVNGEFGKLPTNAEPKICTMEYNPVTARATGTYKGKRIEFKAVYSNPCVAASDSSDVFRW